MALQGHHIWDFVAQPDWLPETRKLAYATELLFLPVVVLTKLSILIFYQRLFPSGLPRYLHVLIYIGMLYTVIVGISCFFAAMFQCRPIAAFWDYTIDGNCYVSYGPQLAVAILNSVG